MYTFRDCYFETDENGFRIGNALVERSFSTADGALTPGALTDKTAGYAAAPAPSEALALPFGPFDRVSVTCGTEDNGGMSEPFLTAAVVMENGSAVQTLHLEVFPELPFLSMRMTVCPKGSSPAENADEWDVVDRFALPSVHCRVEIIELIDKSDYADTLVRRSKDTPYPKPRHKNGYRGDIFLLESALQASALLVSKDAPVGRSHLRRPASDLTIEREQVRVWGSGVDFTALVPGEETEYYGVTLGVGQPDMLLRLYKRLLCRLRRGEGRLLALANTWGARSCEKHLNDAFMHAELQTAQRIGADGVTIDDGWEKGAIKDPTRYMEHIWEGYHRTADDYWSVDPGRFPEGLEPAAQEACRLGVSLGLWFSPDSADDFAGWQKDAEILEGFNRRYGIRMFKLDGICLRSKTGERNLCRLLEALNRLGFLLQLDVTANDRFGYHYKPQYGIQFVENRYTDWGNYYPYRTLRNLWMLSDVLPARAMQFEALNPRRNAEKYADDPFAPCRYDADYLFACVMVSNPLLWFELSHMEPADLDALSRILHVWQAHAAALYAAEVLPIGKEPDGMSCTGFAALSDADSGYLILIRERNDCGEAVYRVPELAGRRLRYDILASNGEGAVETQVSGSGQFTARFSRPDQYLFIRYTAE